MANENNPVLETEPVVAEEFKANEEDKEVCPKCGKPLDECECEKDDEKKDEEFAKKNDDEEEEAPAQDDEADKKDEDEDEDKKKKEFATEKCPKCGKPLDECTCEDEDDDEEDKPAKYTLEEIPEYIELRNQYDALNEAHEALKSECESLTNFKLNVERKEKEAMIDRFYMLSDEDKQDVKDNIDTYSLDDIEAKLSVICVRNKVSFDLDENNSNNEEPTVYSLNNSDDEDANVPAWVKSLRSNRC